MAEAELHRFHRVMLALELEPSSYPCAGEADSPAASFRGHAMPARHSAIDSQLILVL
jgi:hypothetical protein